MRLQPDAVIDVSRGLADVAIGDDTLVTLRKYDGVGTVTRKRRPS
jgi:hypothetical protein